MKVLLINGSPKVKGCTYTALCEVAKELEKQNIENRNFSYWKQAYSRLHGLRRLF